MRLRARARPRGKIATGIAVRVEVVDCLGRGERPPESDRLPSTPGPRAT